MRIAQQPCEARQTAARCLPDLSEAGRCRADPALPPRSSERGFDEGSIPFARSNRFLRINSNLRVARASRPAFSTLHSTTLLQHPHWFRFSRGSYSGGLGGRRPICKRSVRPLSCGRCSRADYPAHFGKRLERWSDIRRIICGETVRLPAFDEGPKWGTHDRCRTGVGRKLIRRTFPVGLGTGLVVDVDSFASLVERRHERTAAMTVEIATIAAIGPYDVNLPSHRCEPCSFVSGRESPSGLPYPSQFQTATTDPSTTDRRAAAARRAGPEFTQM